MIAFPFCTFAFLSFLPPSSSPVAFTYGVDHKISISNSTDLDCVNPRPSSLVHPASMLSDVQTSALPKLLTSSCQVCVRFELHCAIVRTISMIRNGNCMR